MRTRLREQIEEQIRQASSRSISSWEFQWLEQYAEAHGVSREKLLEILSQGSKASDTSAFESKATPGAEPASSNAGNSNAETRLLPIAPPGAQMRIAKNIEKLRRECGWSFDELAKKIDSDKTNVMDHAKDA